MFECGFREASWACAPDAGVVGVDLEDVMSKTRPRRRPSQKWPWRKCVLMFHPRRLAEFRSEGGRGVGYDVMIPGSYDITASNINNTEGVTNRNNQDMEVVN